MDPTARPPVLSLVLPDGRERETAATSGGKTGRLGSRLRRLARGMVVILPLSRINTSTTICWEEQDLLGLGAFLGTRRAVGPGLTAANGSSIQGGRRESQTSLTQKNVLSIVPPRATEMVGTMITAIISNRLSAAKGSVQVSNVQTSYWSRPV